MTKRILALLLALLLLPAAALAEASRIDLTLTLDAENAAEVFKATGLFAGADNEDALCDAMVDFMDGFAMSLITQDDAVRMEIAFGETPLLDLSVLMGGENLIITSDLMEGAGLSVPMALLNAENDEFARLLADTDWADMLSTMLNAAVRSFDGVQGVETRGSFSGDAYTGGVYCTTYTFDDKAVAGLVDALLTDDFRALVNAAADYWDFDGAAFLAGIDEANAKAAEENAHRYIVRLVRDADYAPVGMSVTVLRGEEQLATLSIGLASDALRIVAGFGMDDVNYWHSQVITCTQSVSEDGTATTVVNGQLTEFTAPKSDDFAYASANMTDALLTNDWSMTLAAQGSGMTWRCTSTQKQGSTGDVTGMEGQGLYLPGVRFANTCTYSTNGKSYMTERLTWAPCDPIPSDGAGLELYSLLSGDDADVTALATSVGLELAERLMKIVPFQLLMYFQ